MDKEINEILPYKYLAGGHNILLKFNDDSICKTYEKNEFLIYQNIPEPLQSFIPKFKGLALVRKMYLNGSKRDYALIGKKLEQKHYYTDYIELCQLYRDFLNANLSDFFPLNYKPTSLDESGFKYSIDNSKKRLTSFDNDKRFILLEDLTKDYTHPCIIDIKMGNNSNLSPNYFAYDKIIRKTARIQESTAFKYGFRFCGLVVYDVYTNSYTRIDKYVGRNISIEQFKNYLISFFPKDISCRKLMLSLFIKELCRLKYALKSLTSFRFFSTSILLIYEHSQIITPVNAKINVKMVDFAESWIKLTDSNDSTLAGEGYDGKDDCYISSLENLIKLFQKLVEVENQPM